MLEKTLTVEKTTDSDTQILCKNKSYTSTTKGEHLIQFLKQNKPSETLKIVTKNHEQHESLTEFHGTNRFLMEEANFSLLTHVPKLIYSPKTDLENFTKKEIYYVDDKDGLNPSQISGLGKIRFSLKPEKKKRYFIATGIKDCIFLTVFNKKNRTSFNLHTNASRFLDENASEVRTFLPELTKSLTRVKDSCDYLDLEVTLVSLYLSNGLRYLHYVIANMKYSNIKIDYAALSGTRNFVIRKVGPMVKQERFHPENFFHREWTRPVEVFIDPVRYPNGALKKNIIFDANTGKLFLLEDKEL